MYISSAEPSRGRFFLDRRMTINKVSSSFIEILDAALNKIFKKENFNFFKEPNSKRFKISS